MGLAHKAGHAQIVGGWCGGFGEVIQCEHALDVGKLRGDIHAAAIGVFQARVAVQYHYIDGEIAGAFYGRCRGGQDSDYRRSYKRWRGGSQAITKIVIQALLPVNAVTGQARVKTVVL